MYQCLCCKSQWEVRYFGDKFCGFCGISFDGQHFCRTSDQPRWHFDLYGDWNKVDVPSIPYYRQEEPQWCVDWCLVEYYNHPEIEVEWSREEKYPSYYRAQDIWAIVKEGLEDVCFPLIYRVRKNGRKVLFYSK